MTFTPDTFRFLTDLTAHNDRDWFNANRDRYEAHVKAPSLAFIEALAPRMKEVSPHIRVDAKALFRIHRDTRFSHDKAPYKTNIGLHFRHDSAKDVHAPGFYMQLGVDDSFIGLGLWRPDAPSLLKIRAYIVKHPAELAKADAAGAKASLNYMGDTLQRVPKPWDKDHPLADALRRKDWIQSMNLNDDEAVRPDLIDRFVDVCKAGAPLMRVLCAALERPF